MTDFSKVDKKVRQKLEKASIEREARVVPVVKQILALIAESGLSVGTLGEDAYKKYGEVAQRVIQVMIDAGLRYADKDMLFQLVLQPSDQLKDIVLRSLNRSFEKAEETLFGKPYMDLDLKDIDRVLKGAESDKIGRA